MLLNGNILMKKVKCSSCGSSAVRSREVVHKSGTSFSSGRSSTSGISFNLTGRAKPRVWFGGGRSTNKRQSIRAQEAEPLSYWPALMIPALIIAFHSQYGSYGLWSWLGFAFSVLWFTLAWSDHTGYKKEWLCSKCGAKFLPEEFMETQEAVATPPEPTPVKQIYDNSEKDMPSNKDYTKYIFNGEKYGKGRLVLSILKQHSNLHPDGTFNDLKNVFPDFLQSNTEIQFSGTQVVFEKENNIPQGDSKRFFSKEEEKIQIKDCKVVVTREWNHQNIQNFINAAGKLGYEISVSSKYQA